MPEPEMVSLEEAARLAGVSEAQLRQRLALARLKDQLASAAGTITVGESRHPIAEMGRAAGYVTESVERDRRVSEQRSALVALAEAVKRGADRLDRMSRQEREDFESAVWTLWAVEVYGERVLDKPSRGPAPR